MKCAINLYDHNRIQVQAPPFEFILRINVARWLNSVLRGLENVDFSAFFCENECSAVFLRSQFCVLIHSPGDIILFNLRVTLSLKNN